MISRAVLDNERYGGKRNGLRIFCVYFGGNLSVFRIEAARKHSRHVLYVICGVGCGIAARKQLGISLVELHINVFNGFVTLCRQLKASVVHGDGRRGFKSRRLGINILYVIARKIHALLFYNNPFAVYQRFTAVVSRIVLGIHHDIPIAYKMINSVRVGSHSHIILINILTGFFIKTNPSAVQILLRD